MIGYLIFDQTKNGLKRSCILKFMNFLIFKDFFEFFWIYFGFVLIKIIKN